MSAQTEAGVKHQQSKLKTLQDQMFYALRDIDRLRAEVKNLEEALADLRGDHLR